MHKAQRSRQFTVRKVIYDKEPLIDLAAHLRHIFFSLLLAEKLDVHPVHLALFAIVGEKNLYRICTTSFNQRFLKTKDIRNDPLFFQ